jgi:anti-sigma factor ChrR (cupin superfamily)
MTDDRSSYPQFAREALEGTDPADRRDLLEQALRLPEALAPGSAPTRVREGLLQEVARAPERYAPLLPAVSELFDIPRGDAQALLERSVDPKAWRRSGLPGIKKLPVEVGVSRARAQAYVVTFAAGASFPEHHHDGVETVLLLAGSYTEYSSTYTGAARSAERVYRTGDIHLMEPGTAHSFEIAPAEDCVAATLLHGKLNFRSLPLRLLARLLGH